MTKQQFALRFTGVLVAVISCFNSLTVPAPAASTFTIARNEIYNIKMPKSGMGDVYEPALKPGQLAPAVVIVHSGGWIGGSKGDAEVMELAVKLASEGFVVFAVDYRLIQDGGTYPHNIDDVKAAVSYFIKKSDTYHVDPDRVGIAGISAGAYLALMAAYTPGDAKKHLKAVAAICPATDLQALINPVVGQYVESGIRSNQKKFKKTSPITFAADGIPTLLMHGTADQLIPFEQSERLDRALKKENVKCEFVPFKGADHTFILAKGPNHDKAIAEVVRFMKEQLVSKS